ncbi:MAG: lysophospholipid acyltransferase family protein [Alphaproteobacteria bacterium]
MRSFLFNMFFYAGTFFYAFISVIFSFVPGRRLMMASLRRYTKVMTWAMRVIAGIDVKVSGHENVPKDGPVIIAAKHQSYGDGIVMFSQFFDLSFVTGDHLEKFMFLKRILAKMNAVVIDSCGGEDSRKKMAETSAVVREQGRRILIYPEGHLSKIGTHHKYRKGVYHLYKDFNCPVVPVATNLGQRWNQSDWQKHAGSATLEFLQPIMPGLEKEAFMQQLQSQIETRSLELLDMDNLGALNPSDIGKLEENDVAKAKRLEREADDKEPQS